MKRNLIVAGAIILIFGLSIFMSHRQAAQQQRRLEIRVRHILVGTQGGDPVKKGQALEKITEIRERILAGEDFAGLAKEYSEDGSTAFMGGDLGFRKPGDFDKPFRDTVLELEKGEISDIVETAYGYHIIQVLGRRGPATEQ